jgi:SAM-dependent methyltransferase
MDVIYRNGKYLKNNPGWHSEDAAWKAAQILKLFKRNRLTPKTVCDIGCGAGDIVLNLSSMFGGGVRFVGYEISPQAFRLCSAKNKLNVTFVNGGVSEIGDFFDVVMAIDVLEHIEDYIGFARGLRSKGEFKVFHIPLDLSVQAIFRNTPLLNSREKAGHLHFFTKDIALSALCEAGYKILDYFYTCGSLDLPGKGFNAFMLKFPRKLAMRFHRDFAARLLGGFSLMILTQ